MRIVAIAAIAENGVIGSGEDMLWHLPEDFKRFREVTSGNTLIFGRRTHEQIGKALPNRRTIVVTRQAGWSDEGVEVAHSVEEALELAAQTPDRVAYIGGGSQIYEAAWPYLTELDLTHVHARPEGAARFPIVSRREWTEISREPRDGFDFVQYLPTPNPGRFTRKLPAWPLLQSLAAGRPMAEAIALVDDVNEAGEWLAQRGR